MRPTRAEINLAHLRHNFHQIKRLAGDAEVWGVLKADAYGHGAPAVARTLERTGCAGLCVALLEEGIELREAGIRVPILVMSGYYGRHLEGLSAAAEHGLTPVIYDRGQVEAASFLAKDLGEKLTVHVKIDTGMSRLGAPPSEARAMLAALAAHPELDVEGLMTHFACADDPDPEATREQIARFESFSQLARELGLKPRMRHAANSAGLLWHPDARYDMVRPGIALFGVTPSSHVLRTAPDGLRLKPVLRVRTEIVALRELAAGDSVGYGYTFRATRPTRIATVPIGYADGLLGRGQRGREVLVRGKRAPVAGAISMDLTTIDVTDIPDIRLGDEVVFLGPQDTAAGSDEITADEVARYSDTISWEVMTSISRRVPRFYREP